MINGVTQSQLDRAARNICCVTALCDLDYKVDDQAVSDCAIIIVIIIATANNHNWVCVRAFHRTAFHC